jgi:hypothetical protein
MYGLTFLFGFSRTLSNRLSESFHGIGVFLGSQFSLKLGNGSITALWLLIISNQDLVEGLALAYFASGCPTYGRLEPRGIHVRLSKRQRSIDVCIFSTQ